MRFLKTNTAVIVTVGPFYDKTDGVTIEGALTITNERITLTADTDAGSAPTLILDNITGATSGTANDLNYITNTDAGLMQLELAAADVNRLGRMFLTITDAANHVPVFHEFMVLSAAAFDWMFGSTIPPVNATQFAGQTISAAAGVTLPTSVASPTNITAGVITTVTNLTNAPTSGDLTATMKTSVTTAATAATPIAASVAGAVGSVTGAVGSVTVVSDKTGYALSATGSAALTESYAADGAAATLPQLLYMIQQMLTEFAITTTTLSVKKLDGTTEAATFTLDSATTPTSITRAT